MEFENAFSRPGKEWILEKMTQVMEVNEISLSISTAFTGTNIILRKNASGKLQLHMTSNSTSSVPYYH